jgi:zinc ribbon protein
MFCNQCGAPLQQDYRVCPKCGNAVQGPIAATQPGRVARHIQVLAILWIIVGVFWLIPATVMLVLGGVAHMFIPFGETMGRTLGPFVLHVLGGIFLLVAAGAFCVGWGLLQRRPWARTVTLVLGFLALFHPPFATALGIYTLWVLLPESSGREYTSMAGQV